jgi:hypothetical protein
MNGGTVGDEIVRKWLREIPDRTFLGMTSVKEDRPHEPYTLRPNHFLTAWETQLRQRAHLEFAVKAPAPSIRPMDSVRASLAGALRCAFAGRGLAFGACSPSVGR